MSIEKHLKELTEAIKTATIVLEQMVDSVLDEPPVAAPPVAAPPVAAPPVAAPPVAAPPVAAAVTIEDVNAALVAEVGRNGGDRTPIDNILHGQFKVQSLRELPVEQYQPLIDAVKSLAGV